MHLRSCRLTLSALAAALLASCSPIVSEQDSTGLWLENSRTYDEVFNSVTAVVDPALGAEEYHIYDKDGARYVAGGSQAGIMYGVYALQRLEALGQADGKTGMEYSSKPAYDLRILNHWDNLDDSVERGYAGPSMWEWTSDRLPVDRVRFYAELCASVGINGSVVNNVNSNPAILDDAHLQRIKEIADILREYGIKTYVSIKWTSPMALSGVKTGDPMDPSVRQWWKDKAAQIYALIPDFGGFLVKANSEGQEGPQDHGRTHADGANMLAEAVAPYGGIVMWRAFVYDPSSEDRANQAVEEFVPLDGQFADNVIVQIKNGPIDFQPREPFSPLFGQLRNTRMMVEFQITQEYLGFSNHLVYHGPTFEECLDADTYRDGQGSTVAKMVTGIAGVANTGQDANFSGYLFAQSNWYAFGRLAWDPELSSEQIAEEWVRQTFDQPGRMSDKAFDSKVVKPIVDIMMSSREAAVNYMQPLGLHHMFAGSHYGPGPWESSYRRDWSPTFYHKAAEDGIGFDRTRETGTDNVDQYHEPVASMFNNPKTCPDELLLWFHHLPWDYVMRSGRTLWDEICLHYDSGINTVEDYIATWDGIRPYISKNIYEEVARKLQIQRNDAEWWRDACAGYFQSINGLAQPSDVKPFTTPIDSLRGRSIQSLRNGMPVHGDDLKPIILKPQSRQNPGTLPEGFSSH